MPIDEEDQTENQENAEEQKPKRPGPILHTPKSGSAFPIKIIIPVILVIAVTIGGFWLYKQKSNKNAEKPPVVVNMPTPDTGQAQIQQPTEQLSEDSTAQKAENKTAESSKEVKNNVTPSTISKVETKKSIAKPEPMAHAPASSMPKTSPSAGGKYSIIVGSFKEKKNADELYARWKEAGMQVYLTDKGVWHRVSLGKYPSQAEARREAEKMHDSFKDGYYIDIVE